MSAGKRVLILGGGIGGLTAGLELSRRGFEVQILEKGSQRGGKSRSIPVPETGTEGRPDLPGEHGFRFFPGFYQHLPDVLSLIPFGAPGRTCANNLVDTSEVLLTRFDRPTVSLPARFPRSPAEFYRQFTALLHGEFGLTPEESEFFVRRILQVMTSCKERRLAELEKISWWDYVEADRFSDNYRRLLTEGLSRSLVAARAREASARTIGQVQAHLFSHILRIGGATDRVLDGPTSERMIDPWIAAIEANQGHYRTESEVVEIEVEGQAVSGIVARNPRTHETTRLSADWYVAALPIEAMSALVAPLTADPILAGLPNLAADVRWMNGVQFFLNRDLRINHGHTLHVDTPWALTSISQAQFWPQVRLDGRGDGSVRGILSVCISDWDVPGLNGKKARECTAPHEVTGEVWEQLKRSLNHTPQGGLSDEMVITSFLDPAIRLGDEGETSSSEPLFINRPDSWRRRPTPTTEYPNLFLAADYVQTNADLACMECACEAGRKVTNAILGASGSNRTPCRLFELEMPKAFELFRIVDKLRFKRKNPWFFDLNRNEDQF